MTSSVSTHTYPAGVGSKDPFDLDRTTQTPEATSHASVPVSVTAAATGSSSSSSSPSVTNTTKRRRRRLPYRIEKFSAEGEWVTARRKYIGSSDAPQILGESRFGNALTVWAAKKGIEMSGPKTLFAMGHAMESINEQRFEEETGYELHNPGDYCIYVSTEIPYVAATVDRIVSSVSKGKGICELKYSPAGIKERREYWVQLQHQLFVTGREWGCVSVLDAYGEWDWFPYDRDDAFISQMLEKYAEFWWYVQNDEQPPVDASEWSLNALKGLYPKDNGESVVLPPEAVLWDEELRDIESQLKPLREAQRALESRRAGLQALLLAEMKSAKTGIGPGFSYECSTVERKPIPASSYRRIRRIEGKA